MDEKPVSAEPKRRWYQFSLEGLFVILVVLAACVGIFYWVSRPTRDDEKRAKVIEQLKVLGDALKKHHEAMKKSDKDFQTPEKSQKDFLGE